MAADHDCFLAIGTELLQVAMKSECKFDCSHLSCGANKADCSWFVLLRVQLNALFSVPTSAHLQGQIKIKSKVDVDVIITEFNFYTRWISLDPDTKPNHLR